MKEQYTMQVDNTKWIQLPVGTLHFSNTMKKGALYHKLSATQPTTLNTTGLRPIFQYEDVMLDASDICWVMSNNTNAEYFLYTI